MIVEFLFWSTPEFLSYIIALAVLLSALVTIGLLTKNSELIVMRACGISLYRTALPMVAFALGASAVLFGMEERVLATANQRADRLKHIIRTGTPQTFGVLNRKWIVGSDGEVYHYQYYDPRKRELNSLVGLRVRSADARAQVAHVRADARPTTRTASRDGEMPKWALERGLEARVRSDDRRPAPSSASRTSARRFEPADYFVTEAREPELMNFGQLRALHHRAQARAATTCSITRSACTARSRSRS